MERDSKAGLEGVPDCVAWAGRGVCGENKRAKLDTHTHTPGYDNEAWMANKKHTHRDQLGPQVSSQLA